MNEEQRLAIKKLIDAKIALWNAASEVEKLFETEIETGNDSYLDHLCVAIYDKATDEDAQAYYEFMMLVAE